MGREDNIKKMKYNLFLVAVCLIVLSCKKKETAKDEVTQTPPVMSASETALVGKWTYEKKVYYNSSGTPISTLTPSPSDSDTFINLTSELYGNSVTTPQYYKEYYGVSGTGAVTSWRLEEIVAGKQKINCYPYPATEYVNGAYIYTVTANLLVIDNFTTTIPYGSRIHYHK